MAARSTACLCAALALTALATGCGDEDRPGASGPGEPSAQEGFRSADCNGITDADIVEVAGAGLFTPAVVSDAGCFWQEESMVDTVGAGMGISTWWYRGSDMGTEREIEEQAGRTLVELSVDDNDGFKAFDDSACSIYVAKGDDVVTWSIQTLNAQTMPDLCPVIEHLAELSQQRVN